MMLISRLFDVGHSLVATIPMDYRRRLGFKKGDIVYWEIHKDRSLIIRSLDEALKEKRRLLNRGDEKSSPNRT